MATGSTFKIVIGYLAGIDRWPDEPRTRGLQHRFAFVLDTCRPGATDLQLDERLYREIVAASWKLAGADAAELVGDGGERRRITSLDELEDVFHALVAEPREPLARILFERARDVVLVAESEPYARVGVTLVDASAPRFIVH